MTLYDAIFTRKSIRSFNTDPVEQSLIDELVDFLSDLEAPLPNIDWDFDTLTYSEISDILEGPPKLLAPHFLVLRSEKNKGCLQNCGYIGEMAVLWLTAHGIATCWQGGLSCVHDFDGVLPYIAAIGFGRSEESFRSGVADFNRKPLGHYAIGDTNGPLRTVMEAMPPAPSSLGMQATRLYCIANRIHIYRKRPFPPMPQLNYNQCLDAGVIAAHLQVAGNALGYDVLMEKLEPAPEYKKNMIYQMSARCIRRDAVQTADDHK